MGKTSKATRKFQKKHLKHTIEHRKEVQKHNKKIGSRKNGNKSVRDGNDSSSQKAKNAEVFEDMPIDEFFDSGFEVPKTRHTKPSNVSDDSGLESSEEEDEEQMREEMNNLASKDPAFYNYLKENDSQLLDFEEMNPLDAISDDEDDEGSAKEEDGDNSGSDTEKTSKIEITPALVKGWKKKLEEPSVGVIRNICIAFKAAVNAHVEDEGDYKYTITDPDAFDLLTNLVLKNIPDAIQKLIKYKVNSSTKSRSIPQKNPYVKQVTSILKSHAGSYIILLKDMANTETAAYVLSSMQEIFPYYLSQRRLLRHILKSIIDVWVNSKDISTQIAAFAFINNVTKEFPKSILENVLKSLYSSLLQNCRHTNIYSMPAINFCKNSATELFGIDETISYQVGFEYVRQLAVHLRNSMNQTSNAKEGFKLIYNWQYCHALDFWSRVVSQYCNPEKESTNHKNKESPLRQLIYPLIQVTLGTIRLIPTAQFYPLRFYLIRSLLRISQSTGVYIPIFPLISEILSSKAIKKASKKSQLVAFDFEHLIKANQAYLGTRTYQDGLCEQFIDLTGDFFALYSKNIAFPELVTPAVISLRRFIKGSKNAKFNRQLQQLVEKLNANASFIQKKRSKVEFSASNRTEVQLFLKDLDWQKTPLGQYVTVQREIKETKLRALREAAAENGKPKSNEVDQDESDINISESGESSEDEASDAE